MNTVIKAVLVSLLMLSLLHSVSIRSEAGEISAGITLTVNSTADQPDAAPGDGVCEATAGKSDCTLRAAVMEANANSNPEVTIHIPAGLYRLSIPAVVPEDDAHGSLKISRSLTLSGAGSSQTTVDGDGNKTHDRAFRISSSANNSAVTIQGLTIQEGHLTGIVPIVPQGGGMYVEMGSGSGASGTFLMQDVLFQLNSTQGAAASGGALYLEGWSQSSFTLSNVTISNNSTGSDSFAGAGLQFESGDFSSSGNSTLLIQDSIIKNNSASPFTTGNPLGGGIDVRHGNVTVSTSTLADNLADQGGGISVDGINSQFDLVNSTLSGNQANINGGGIYSVNGATFLSSSTVMSNASDYDLNGSGEGGGIYQGGPATVTLANSLVIFNHETEFDPVNQVYVRNHGDLRGAFISNGFNGFIDTLDSSFTGQHDLDRYDITLAFIGDLAYNGGYTPTHALFTGSEAINSGNPVGCLDPSGNPLAMDQRGFPRVMGGRCDIGAYEYNPNPDIYIPILLK